MTDPAAIQDPETDRRVSQLVDEILDYRAALGRIADNAITHDLVAASVLTLGNRLVMIRTEAKTVLTKVRR